MPTPTTDAAGSTAVVRDPVATDGRDRTWSIAQVADEFGVTHRTVRHYEGSG